MQLTHVALWTNDLERLRSFYVTYFGGKSHEKYTNPKKGFASYFVTFESGSSLEIMQRNDISDIYTREHIGLAHIAFLVPSRAEVHRQIDRLRSDGYTISGEPRLTGDGYYEGAVLDPDGTPVEIVAYGEVEIARALFYPYDLLLEADPDREKVDEYLPVSDCYVATSGSHIVGVIVVQPDGRGKAEIRNLAVAEAFRRRGIARQLLRYVSNHWAPRHGVDRLKICTGTSAAGPLLLYQQEGYDLVALDRDYFVRQYAEPIWENGVQCRHQLILEKRL